MRPAQVLESLNMFLDIQRPVLVTGSPGGGKSDVVRQVAKSRNSELRDVRLAQLDAVDLRGVPSVDAAKQLTMWNTPNFLPTEGKGVLFLDEIVSAPQAVQAAAYQLVLDRRLGDYVLPDGWAIIAAGNKQTDGAIVNPMSTALKNRFAHITYEVNNEDWCNWAVRSGVSPEVVAFIRFRPALLNEFEQRGSSDEEKSRLRSMKNRYAFATPRTWEVLSDVITHGTPDALFFDIAAGIVGEGAAGEFSGYLKYYRNLPDFDEILRNPKTAAVPDGPGVLYALASGLAAVVTGDTFTNLTTYLARIPTEFQVLCVKDALARMPEIADSKAFVTWAVDNEEVLF